LQHDGALKAVHFFWTILYFMRVYLFYRDFAIHNNNHDDGGNDDDDNNNNNNCIA